MLGERLRGLDIQGRSSLCLVGNGTSSLGIWSVEPVTLVKSLRASGVGT